MIRIELPQHLRTLAHVDREITLEVDGSGLRSARCLTRWRRAIPCLRGTIRDHGTQQRRAFCDFSPVRKIFPTSRQTRRYPKRLPRAKSHS